MLLPPCDYRLVVNIITVSQVEKLMSQGNIRIRRKTRAGMGKRLFPRLLGKTQLRWHFSLCFLVDFCSFRKPHRNMKPSATWNSETHWGPTAASGTSRCSADVRLCPVLSSWSPDQMQDLCFGSDIPLGPEGSLSIRPKLHTASHLRGKPHLGVQLS